MTKDTTSKNDTLINGDQQKDEEDKGKAKNAGNKKSSDAHKRMNLFRGMKDLKIFDEFMEEGGTEFAPMSTTADPKVALEYSQGGNAKRAMLLWLRTNNFMDRGVELTWISAFPHEQEFLYPPLTYLKPLKKEPVLCKIGDTTYQVIEVSPQP